MSEDYTETSGSIARVAGINQATVRLYVNLGLIECKRTPDGRMLFRHADASLIRQLYDARMDASRHKARRMPHDSSGRFSVIDGGKV